MLDTSLVDRLAEVLDREIAIYEGVLKLSKNKTDALVAGKVSELEGITRLEQSAILKLGKLEGERGDLAEKLAAEIGLKAEDATLANIIAGLPADKAEKLKKRRDRISAIFDDLRGTNTLNSKLIQNSLEYIDFSINLLAGAGAKGSYDNSGESGGTAKRNFFDMRL